MIRKTRYSKYSIFGRSLLVILLVFPTSQPLFVQAASSSIRDPELYQELTPDQQQEYAALLKLPRNNQEADDLVNQQLAQAYIPNTLLLRFQPGLTDSLKEKLYQKTGINHSVERTSFIHPGAPGKKTKSEVLIFPNDQALRTSFTQLLRQPEVLSVEPDRPIEPAWLDNGTRVLPDNYDRDQYWFAEKTQLPELWSEQGCARGAATCGGSSSSTVAVIDTGLAFEDYAANFDYDLVAPFNTVTPNHEETYTPNFAKLPSFNTTNLWTNPEEAYGGGDTDENGICDDLHGADIGIWLYNTIYDKDLIDTNCTSTSRQKEGHPNDDNGHGTFVSGLISQMASSLKIMPIKSTDPFENSTALSLSFAIYYAIDPHDDGSYRDGAQVINISQGSTAFSSTLLAAVNAAYDAGVLVIGAAGNNGQESTYYPAGHSNALSIGALTPTNQIASYSSWGKVDFVAPVGEGSTLGQALHGLTFDCATGSSECNEGSDFTDFEEDYWTGTSFAAPQAAVAVALYLSRNPGADPAEVKTALENTSIDVMSVGQDSQSGHGLINLEQLWNYGKEKSITAVRGSDGGIYTRSSTDFQSWSLWELTCLAASDVTLVQFNAQLFQAVRGTDQGIYTRFSTDAGDSWSIWQLRGICAGEITMIVFGQKLFQAVKGTDGGIYTRFSLGGTNWSGWQLSGLTDSNITMAVFNSQLFQAVRGTDGGIYTRFSADGEQWSAWQLNGLADSSISMVVFQDQLYQAVQGSDQVLYTRSSPDGIGWSAWQGGGQGIGEISLGVYYQKLFQASRGKDGKTYTRATENGSDWSEWQAGEAIEGVISQTQHGKEWVQSVRGPEQKIYLRTTSEEWRSDAAAWWQNNWSAWQEGGTTGGEVTLLRYFL